MTSKGQLTDKEVYKSNLVKIIIETILSSIGAGFSVATITVFWNSVGMNQVDIGFVQMIFTVVICLLDIPMGYVADRCNRKVLNVIGDIGVAFVFLLYALAKDMNMVLISESLLGLFMAMTNGVDQSFIKFNCDKIDETGNLFKKTNVKVHTARCIMLFIVTAVGGIISKYSMRVCIGISFVPYFIGGVVGLFIKDYNKKMEVVHKNPLKDMIHSVKEIVKDKNTKVYLMSYVLGKEITHSQIWVFTPLMLLVGIPVEIVSLGWILNYLTQIIGSKLSERMIKYKTSTKFAIPIIIEISWMTILIVNTNAVTVWLFAFNGLVQGLVQGNLLTALQTSVTDEIQTSVMSVASTGARLLYIPLVYLVNFLGEIKLQLAFLGVVCVFLPMSIIVFNKLKKLEE